jgi:hypothetical protein
MIIAQYQNNEYGIESIVHQIGAFKFSVSLKDIDANEILPTQFFYKDLGSAIEHAKKIACIK